MLIKKILLSITIVTLLISCSQGKQKSSQSEGDKKILIVYYSWGGNTREIAKQIENNTGGDVFELLPVTAYPGDYNECIEQAKKEISEGYKPKLKSKIKDIESYDIIFLGTPNWYSTIAPPVATFISENNLSGKTVIPFCTHGGGKEANCFTDIKKLCPKSTVLDGLVVLGNNAKSSQDEVEQWLKELKINN